MFKFLSIIREAAQTLRRNMFLENESKILILVLEIVK